MLSDWLFAWRTQSHREGMAAESTAQRSSACALPTMLSSAAGLARISCGGEDGASVCEGMQNQCCTCGWGPIGNGPFSVSRAEKHPMTPGPSYIGFALLNQMSGESPAEPCAQGITRITLP